MTELAFRVLMNQKQREEDWRQARIANLERARDEWNERRGETRSEESGK